MNQIKYHQFIWSATQENGKKTQGEISAINTNHATILLRQKKIITPKIYRKKNIFIKKISKLQISYFFQQLAILISSGVPLTQSLDMLFQGQENYLFKSVIQSIKNNIESGKNFSESCAQHPKYFDELTCHLIKIAENSGTLDIMLTRITEHKQKQLLLKNKISQALFYPSLILITSLIILLFMMFFIVPKFAEFFQQFHKPLPWITNFILHIANFLHTSRWLLLLLLLTIPILLFYNPLQIKNLIYKIPLLRRVMTDIIFARFTRNLAITFASGMPLTNALTMLTPLVKFPIYQNAINQLKLLISSGQQLHAAMQQADIFPLWLIQMVKVGEESGMLQNMLEASATLFEASIDRFMTNLSQRLEPLIMVGLGALIGGIVIAMYLPIFKLGTVM